MTDKDSPSALRMIEQVAAEKSGGELLEMFPPGCSDLGNAQRFVRDHGNNVRFIADWNEKGMVTWVQSYASKEQRAKGEEDLPTAHCPLPTWIVPSDHTTDTMAATGGGYWRVDNLGASARLAKQTALGIKDEPAVFSGMTREESHTALGNWCARSQESPKLNAMLHVAKSELPIPALIDDFDQQPHLFNCQNGTIDLRSGEFRAARRSDMLTKIAPVVYDEKAEPPPEWLMFLSQVQPGDEGAKVIDFLGRLSCYCLTGATDYRAFFILAGTAAGNNGKTTFIETLRNIMGFEYSRVIPIESLMAKTRNEAMDVIGRLQGARLATSTESEENEKLSVARLKYLSAGDRIFGSRKHRDSTEFKPTHKLIIGTNYVPNVQNAGKAFLKKMYVIPFKVSIPDDKLQLDPDLQTMFAERQMQSGILNWILSHREQFNAKGLGIPPLMQREMDRLAEDENRVGGFLSDYYVRTDLPGDEVLKDDLYRHYAQVCEEARERPIAKRAFGSRMLDLNFEPDSKDTKGARCWRGLRRLHGGESSAPSEEKNRAANQAILDGREGDLWKV